MNPPAGPAEAHPLRRSRPRAGVPEPCAVVLFGATGDLAKRKLAPALYHLARGGNLPSDYAVVGYARRDWTDDQLRDELAGMLRPAGGGHDAEFDLLWP